MDKAFTHVPMEMEGCPGCQIFLAGEGDGDAAGFAVCLFIGVTMRKIKTVP